MSAFDLLTEEDKDKIIRYIQCYGPVDDYAKIPQINDINNILHEWDKEKSKDLLKLFGNQLILNRPYTYSVSDERVIQEIDNILDKDVKSWQLHYFMRQWVHKELFDNYFDNFINLQISIPTLLDYLFTSKALAKNSFEGDTLLIKVPYTEKIWKIQKGMKVIKIIQGFVNYANDDKAKELFEEFRQWHSQLLNQVYLDGTLTLSIHPMDYITMSDNGRAWDSCMRWMPNDNDKVGDYRMGTVECMNSPYIIIAYLQNPKRTFEFDNDYTWNIKKWRELFIVQEGIINEIKGYCYQDEHLTNTALMWIKELAEQNLGWTYDNQEINVIKEYQDDKGNNHRFHFMPNAYMYNDMGTLPKHRGRINTEKLISKYVNKEKIETYTHYIHYGGQATCMCCGRLIPYNDQRSNAVFCADCDPIAVCPCCGEYLNQDNGYYISAYEDPICENCYNEACEFDSLSEDRELNDSVITIYYSDNDEITEVNYDTPYIVTLDPSVYYNERYKELFISTPKHKNYFYYITPDMIKEDKYDEVMDIFNNDIF